MNERKGGPLDGFFWAIVRLIAWSELPGERPTIPDSQPRHYVASRDRPIYQVMWPKKRKKKGRKR